MNERTKTASPYATEAIWDGGLSATGLSADGEALRVGYDAGWPPEQLLLLAAQGSFMTSFLAAARDARLEVLGYMSSGHLDVPDHLNSTPRITLRPCVVLGSDDDVERAARLSTIARRQSVVGRLLGDRIQVDLEVQFEVSSSDRRSWRASTS